MFQLVSSFKPTGDQPQAIEKLSFSLKNGLKNQVLIGVTGSGKTFTIANVIKNLQLPTLVISHNKTLAGQLYQEFRDFFPQNAVSYFVSYYDYYQPESYLPQSNTYIEKEAQINELIDKLRLQTTTNILTRNDVIVVASVSCIYNIGSPREYGNFILEVKIGESADWQKIGRRLAELQYERSEFEFKRGSFRIRGNYMDIYPAYEDVGYRIYSENNVITKIMSFEPLTGIESQKSKIKSQNYKSKIKSDNLAIEQFNNLIIYPAKHYMMASEAFKNAESEIRKDLENEYKALKKQNKLIEAQRLLQRVNYDLEIIKEVGYVNGIENYSRYFDGRAPGDAPFTLIEYFKEAYGDNFLVVIDESHMTVPQIRGMFNGDYSRKKTLIDYGFRLKAAFDNRPLKFEEFYKKISRVIYTSATPGNYELDQIKSQNSKISDVTVGVRPKASDKNTTQKSKVFCEGIVEQLVRPTGILDPEVIIRPAKEEVQDLVREIGDRREKKGNREGKILVTTLTKKIAEDLTEYLKEKKIRAEYLHSDILTLERSDLLEKLRKGDFDVLVGVNLLREGLDLPEVTLVAILDADREGFLRSKTSLIQTMGRAARNVESKVILYADNITNSISQAVDEIKRRRKYQTEYNRIHKITAKTIYKPIRESIAGSEEARKLGDREIRDVSENYLKNIKSEGLTPYDKKRLVKRLELEMKKQAEEMNFEIAIKIRDKVNELKS